MPQRLTFFATCPRGTEDLLALELGELGAAKVRQDRGGVRFHANLNEALHVLLWTRLAMRVLHPLGEGEAEVAGSEGLYAAAAAIPWEEHLTARSTFMVEAQLRDSEHTHSGFVALKIKDAIVDRLRSKLGSRPDVDSHDPDVRVVAHLRGKKLSLSLDLAGEALHRRGLRAQPVAAPVKETLAAAMLRAAGYTGDVPLVDPMCGSGTILLEAAMISIRRAPGLRRAFGVERWPQLGAQAAAILQDLRADARRNERKAEAPIIGFDRDDKAVGAARSNVSAARLKEEISVREADATLPLVLDEISSEGLLITNPPYGDRLQLGGQKGMKTFYYKLGESLGRLKGWKLMVLSGNPAFESAFHHRPSHRRDVWNGPIECQLLNYHLAA